MSNTLEMCAQIVANGFLPASHANYSLTAPYQMIRELNGCMTQNFERPVVNVRQGYWLHSTIVTLTAGQKRVRVPHRCAAGGLDRVEYADNSTAEFRPFDFAPGRQSLSWEGAYGSSSQPRRYEQRGEWIHLLPANDTAGRVLRIWYYARPSKLVYPQSPTLTRTTAIDSAITDRGRITSIAGIASRQVVVNAIPFRMYQTTPAIIVSSMTTGDRVDVVKPNGWHELALVDCPQTFSGSTVTFGGSDPLDDLEVGDYVRAGDETDWPCLPADFHRLLEDLATLTVLVQLDYLQKAQVLGEKCGSDMDRFREVITPRNKDQAVTIDFPDHVMSGGVGGPRGAWGA